MYNLSEKNIFDTISFITSNEKKILRLIFRIKLVLAG